MAQGSSRFVISSTTKGRPSGAVGAALGVGVLVEPSVLGAVDGGVTEPPDPDAPAQPARSTVTSAPIADTVKPRPIPGFFCISMLLTDEVSRPRQPVRIVGRRQAPHGAARTLPAVLV